MQSKSKSKLILWASIVVGFISAGVLGLFLKTIGVSTMRYSERAGEEVTSYGGIYVVIVGVLISLEVYSRLSGEPLTSNDITYRAGWSYWFFGSTAWLVIIYLIELINIQSSFIEFLILLIASLAFSLYLYTHWTSKIMSINEKGSNEVEDTKNEVLNFLSCHSNLSSDLIKEQAIVLANMSDKTEYSIQVDKIKPDILALILITNVIGEYISSGSFHIYRGVLNMTGTDMKKIWNAAINELEIKGHYNKEQVDDDHRWLEEKIKIAG